MSAPRSLDLTLLLEPDEALERPLQERAYVRVPAPARRERAAPGPEESRDDQVDFYVR